MILIFFIIFVCFIGLMVLHELGHFIFAKFFGVRVDEFGLGYPPRLIGKKFGETLYSLNLLPFGAFVKLPGEIEKIEDKRSFSAQPVSKRALIAFGGVLSFWVIAAIIFAIVFNLGARVAVEDTDTNLTDPEVQVTAISLNSPAQIAGLKPGDIIRKLTINNQQLVIYSVKDVQNLAEEYKGQEITLTIERENKNFEVSLTPRVSPPTGEGPIGIGLVRTAIKKYPFWQAIFQGISGTYNLTLNIIQGYWQVISNVSKGVPSGVQLMGPVGIFNLLSQASQVGINYFLQFFGMIAVYIAIFNILPIPALDGGKLLFLGIEVCQKKTG